jgi:hypothetical protein
MHVWGISEIRMAFRRSNLSGKGEPARARLRGEGNIKMDLRERGYDGVEWFHLADRDNWRASRDHGNTFPS